MRSDGYSAVADEQLDRLEQGPDPELYNAVLDASELALREPGLAQASSSVISTIEGIRFRMPVAGRPTHHVFWSATDEGPRIEAIFPTP